MKHNNDDNYEAERDVIRSEIRFGYATLSLISTFLLFFLLLIMELIKRDEASL